MSKTDEQFLTPVIGQVRLPEFPAENFRSNSCQPYFACSNCWHTMSAGQVHTQGKDQCPKCEQANMRELELLDVPVPEVGVRLLCLVCAHFKPWKLFDPTTGCAICVDCHTAAERINRVLDVMRRMYQDNADYIRSNNLGEIHHNQSMKDARDILNSKW